MNVTVADEDLVGVVELLGFVADLCRCEATLVSAALASFVAHDAWDAAELRIEALCHADRLAQAMGFPDASMDPTSSWPTPVRPAIR